MGNCCTTDTDLKYEEGIEIQTDANSSLEGHSPRIFTPVSAHHLKDSVVSKTAALSRFAGSDFFQRLEKGIEAMVIPIARTGIICQIRFDSKFDRFILTKDLNNRIVELHAITRVLSTTRDLQRVENQANLASDANCCALLLNTHSCIALRFNKKEDNQAFIEIVQDLVELRKNL